jgi:hypothetical protein
MQQNLAGGSFTSGNRSTWLGLYSPASGASQNWSQAGLFQGYFAGGDSLGAVHMFYENKRPCGQYIGLDIGVPPSQPYFFLIKNTGSLVSYQCIDVHGNYYGMTNGYQVNYKKGSNSNNPFTIGYMQYSTGQADANTEWQGDFPLSHSYFGCRTAGDCHNSAYGIEVKSTSGWNLCCGSERQIGPGQPLWSYEYEDFWSFKTCPTATTCASP